MTPNPLPSPTASPLHPSKPPIRKRCLLWDWTFTRDSIPLDLPPSSALASLSNWNTWSPPELGSRLPFRPMVRQLAQLEGSDWATLLASDQPIVNFLNEPERAGATPQDAAYKWHDLVIPQLRVARGMRLVGPSCASDSSGEEWLAEFMRCVVGSPPDFLGLHYYGVESRAAIEYIEKMHGLYPGLPVVVSEIACISRDRDEVFRFTAEVANWMDETEWVFEYGFFGCMREVADGFVSPEAQLMTEDGKWTELMRKLMDEQPIKV